MVREIVPGEAALASGARVPGEAGVIRASGNLEGLEDGGEDDDTVEDDDTAEGVVTEALEDGGLVMSAMTDVSWVSRSWPQS